MSDYRSNKTCAEIDAILDSATPKGEVGDAPDVLTLQGARSYAEVLSKTSLICAGRITALYTTGWATIGAEVEISDAFKVKYGDNAPTITKVVLVDKRVIDGTGASTTRFLYSGDYEGCYFVMGDFEGNDTIFELGATKGDWIIAQNKSWSKIVTTRRDIAGIKGEVTAEALAQKLSTPTPANADPLAKQSSLEGFVRKVEGKGLSTEDFTTLLKQKLESLQNYDDSAINKAVSGILELVNDFNEDIANLYNTKQDSCYILPFDLVDLTRVVDGELDAVAFTPDLFDAIQNNRLILLPKVVDEPNGYQAVIEANYYADDVEMYLTIVAIEYDIRISGKFNDGDYRITSSNIVLIPKQKPITDLDTIRQGASRGATSVQGVKLNGSTITRKDENGIVDLGNIEGGGVYVTTLAYKATSKVENTVQPWGDDTFGAPIIRHEYDEKTGVGVIYFSGRITTIGEGAFARCSSLTSVTIPDSVTTIGELAFIGCYNLTSINIPDGVTTIGYYAFYGCSSLTSVTIPNSVTEIVSAAFEGCTSLTSVTIGDSVTTIGARAFLDCSSLSSVYCKAITPPAGGASAFANNAPNRKIYVPIESVEAYKSDDYWSWYADDIVGYRFNADLNDYYTKEEVDSVIASAITATLNTPV